MVIKLVKKKNKFAKDLFTKKYKPKDRETIFNQSCAIPAYPDARYNESFKGWELEMWNGRELQALIADGFSKPYA